MANQWGDFGEIECSERDLAAHMCQYMPQNASGTTVSVLMRPVNTGDEWLAYMGVKGDVGEDYQYYVRDFVVLGSWVVFFRIVAFLALVKRSKSKGGAATAPDDGTQSLDLEGAGQAAAGAPPASRGSTWVCAPWLLSLCAGLSSRAAPSRVQGRQCCQARPANASTPPWAAAVDSSRSTVPWRSRTACSSSVTDERPPAAPVLCLQRPPVAAIGLSSA